MQEPIREAWNSANPNVNKEYVRRRTITIDPITRLEGHGKIEIFLDDQGDVDRAYLQVPELRGFETFCVGRPAEDMPQITSRICGVCPTAHHMAATKALDDLYQVQPPPTALKIRDLVYNAFMLEDHALHVYILGGPDFIVGPEAPKELRNVVGVIQKVGVDVGKRVIAMRRRLREMISYFGGKVIHPVFGLPGGVSKGLAPADLPGIKQLAHDAVDFARFTLQVFKDVVLKNERYLTLITSEAYTHRTYYMGLVNHRNQPDFYAGKVRVVDPAGTEYASFPTQHYLAYISEHVEPWSYVKFCYLKPVGWKGFTEGEESGIYSVAPLARLNASDRMATPLAERARNEFFDTLGGRPVHHTLANHWARVVEIVYAAERFLELASDPSIARNNIRALPTEKPREGIGVVEAPRGTLIHHYKSDEHGILTAANLIVATAHNSARMAMSVDKAARAAIKGGVVDDGILNKVEMAFRAYDPCHACATHSLPGSMPLKLEIFDSEGKLIKEIKR